MIEKPPIFSLVHDPWIPTPTGDVSLVEVLENSRNIPTIFTGNAAQNVAILRWILAVIYRAYGLNAPVNRDEDAGLDQWESVWNADNLYTSEVAAYLDEYASSMTLRNLLVPEMRNAKGMWKDAHVFYPARGLFPQTVPDTLTPAEVVRAALYLNAWDTAGTKTGDPNDPREREGKVYGTRIGSLGWAGATTIVGNNLHETLCLNWVPVLSTPGDKPAWEYAPFHPCGRDGVDEDYHPGVSELLTWQNRRLNAHWEGGKATGFMVSRGDNLPVTAYLGAEPMSGFAFNKTKSSKAKLPIYTPAPMYDPGRSWRCMGGMMPSVTSAATVSSGVGEGSPTRRPSEAARWVGMAASEGVLPVGFVARMHHVSYEYGTKNTVIDSVRSTAFPVPSGALSTDGAYATTVRAAIDYTSEKVSKSIRSFVWAMDIARGSDGDWDTCTYMTEATDEFYAALSSAFNAWAQHTTGGVEELARWQALAYHTVGRVARAQVHVAPIEAFAGSEHDGVIYSASQALDILLYRLRPTKEDEQ